MDAMADDSSEIFDDLYLGLRAGGALRKQRRGEEPPHLTVQDAQRVPAEQLEHVCANSAPADADCEREPTFRRANRQTSSGSGEESPAEGRCG